MPVEDLSRALFFGRFQPFHLGHLEVTKWALRKYDEIVLMIGMASESHTWDNPFTAGERTWMIREALRSEGLPLDRVITATLPTMEVHVGCAWYVAHMVPPVEAIITRNPIIAHVFRDAGLKVDKPPSFNREEYRGEYVRTLIARGDEKWRKLVPSAVVEIIERVGGVKRIKEAMRRD